MCPVIFKVSPLAMVTKYGVGWNPLELTAAPRILNSPLGSGSPAPSMLLRSTRMFVRTTVTLAPEAT